MSVFCYSSQQIFVQWEMFSPMHLYTCQLLRGATALLVGDGYGARTCSVSFLVSRPLSPAGSWSVCFLFRLQPISGGKNVVCMRLFENGVKAFLHFIYFLNNFRGKNKSLASLRMCSFAGIYSRYQIHPMNTSCTQNREWKTAVLWAMDASAISTLLCSFVRISMETWWLFEKSKDEVEMAQREEWKWAVTIIELIRAEGHISVSWEEEEERKKKTWIIPRLCVNKGMRLPASLHKCKESIWKQKKNIVIL